MEVSAELTGSTSLQTAREASVPLAKNSGTLSIAELLSVESSVLGCFGIFVEFLKLLLVAKERDPGEADSTKGAEASGHTGGRKFLPKGVSFVVSVGVRVRLEDQP